MTNSVVEGDGEKRTVLLAGVFEVKKADCEGLLSWAQRSAVLEVKF
jgi:hypothetical protein